MSIRSSNLAIALSVFLGLSLVQPLSAVAGTITFGDLTDTVAVTLSGDGTHIGDTTGRATSVCTGETCVVTLNSPAGFSGGTGFQGQVNIFDHFVGGTISDIITVVPTFTNPTDFLVKFFTITFTSDNDSGTGLISNPSNNLVEDGTVQHANFIGWFTPTGQTLVQDEILFQSDVVETPEPVTLTVLGTGLLGLALARRRRLAGWRTTAPFSTVEQA